MPVFSYIFSVCYLTENQNFSDRKLIRLETQELFSYGRCSNSIYIQIFRNLTVHSTWTQNLDGTISFFEPVELIHYVLCWLNFSQVLSNICKHIFDKTVIWVSSNRKNLFRAQTNQIVILLLNCLYLCNQSSIICKIPSLFLYRKLIIHVYRHKLLSMYPKIET